MAEDGKAAGHVTELIFGRWKSQILYNGVEVGIFEALSDGPAGAETVADELDLDPDATSRLMRALGSLDLLDEDADGRFKLTDAGEVLTVDHPQSLRDVALLEEGPTHYRIWEHLPDILREGGPTGFEREFGRDVFSHAEEDADYAARFNAAMSSFSKIESGAVRKLLQGVDLSRFDRICDVGGGHGHLLSTLLQDAPGVEGTVLEVPSVVEDADGRWPKEMEVEDRFEFVAGDFFESVPAADAYLMKHILHDWTDEECVEILSNVREAAPDGARLFVCELVVPGPDQPHLAKLMDVHMMIAPGGRERTEAEYAKLFEKAGFEHVDTHTGRPPIGVVEARAV